MTIHRLHLNVGIEATTKAEAESLKHLQAVFESFASQTQALFIDRLRTLQFGADDCWLLACRQQGINDLYPGSKDPVRVPMPPKEVPPQSFAAFIQLGDQWR